ncbi:MurR/RpiR family transcriptional regulator [Clostridium estertheticum]|uniref:MurR/RpiR family transcriptional regulator n=1 Tax=Clostridium estertheticum TaxID=238834 RepID=UPI001CF45330|nr:hypothetical protein [Clostridium estertheticum]MCB2362346.1 hypothetical protein [Clostridium estertheticum]
MSKLRASLTAIINSENEDSINYRVAYYLLKNNYIINRISIQDIANNCYCAKSTISRFCHQLGYTDFYQLNQDLYISTSKNENKFNYYIEGSYNENKSKYFNDLYTCLKFAEDNIKEEDVNLLVEDLLKYRNIGIFGKLQSQSVAELFQSDLGLCRKIITASTLPNNQKIFIKNATENTLIIIVSSSGAYFRNYIELSKYPKNKKPKFYLITANEKMFNSNLYDKVIYLPSNKNYASQPRIIDLFLNIVAINYAKHAFNKIIR